MFQQILQFLFPPKCVFCGSLVESRKSLEICQGCYKKVPFFHEGFLPLSHEEPYSSLRAQLICLCKYEGMVKSTILRYKFMNKSGYCRAFAKLLVERIKKMTNYQNLDIIVGVPLNLDRERLRGFNQAQLLAKEISNGLKKAHDPSLLIRVRNTKIQSTLEKSERILNMKDAFQVSYQRDIKNKTVLLVDDIATTGATLGECSKALLTAGAKEVVCAVIASGRKY